MATIGKPAKPNLPKVVSKYISVKGWGLISLNSEFEPCSSSNSWDNFIVYANSIDWVRCGKIFSSNFGHQGVSGATCKWSHHVREIDTFV